VRQTTLEINLGLLKENYRKLLARAGSGSLLVVLKSDAYGHSHREIAATLESLPESSRLHGYGVANVEEGIELRREGIRRAILVLSGIQDYDEDLHRCLEICDLTPVVSSLAVLKKMAKVTRRVSSRMRIHLKVNTGMNRLGVAPAEIHECLKILAAHPELELEGLMSHFSAAERPRHPITQRQVKEFRQVIRVCAHEGIRPRFLHMANSAALAKRYFPEGNLARVGLHLYGLSDPKLRPIARWTAQVYQVRELNKGDYVGYGPRYRAGKKMKMAVLGVGYGDGYRRALSNKADVLLHGKRCPVIGSISMDLTAVDVSRIPFVSVSDRATLLGRDGRQEITADELADHAGTIPWEIMTGISSRVPRVFRDE
jgi:alanine racemase